MASKLSLARALASAVAFVPKGLVGAFIPLMVLPALTIAHLFFPDVEFGLEPGAVVANLGLFLALWLGLLILSLMQMGALYRLALGRKGVGPLGLQLNSVELRLFGASFLLGLLLILICVAPFGVVGYLGTKLVPEVGTTHVSLADLSDVARIYAAKDGPAYLAALAVASAWAYLFFSRLRLYAVATVARSEVVVTSSWSMTRGATLKMMLGGAIVAAPSWGWGVGSLFFTPDADQLNRLTGLRLDDASLATIIMLLLTAVLQPVLAAGFDASAYRQLEGDERRSRVVLSDPEPAPAAPPEPTPQPAPAPESPPEPAPHPPADPA